MTNEGIIAVRPCPSHGTLADYWALTKPDINLMIAIATCAGFYLGYPAQLAAFPVLLLLQTLLGTVLIAAGTSTLNQYVERRFDAQMRRTALRPVASGRLKPSAALWFGVGLSTAGSIFLTAAVSLLASLLAVLTLLSYLFVYTPLKRRTPFCTLIGALPGAMPPLIGWAASSGSLTPAAWMLYLIVFLWQFPHFMAIAWMYREDYDRAGYLVLPRGKARVRLVVLQTVLPLLLLAVLSVAARPLAFTYAAGASLLSLSFFYYGARLAMRVSNNGARKLLFASIVYLPALFALMVIFRT